MQTYTPQLKRQAAWATFDSLLTEEQMMQAIKMLETERLGSNMASLINYINRVGDKFGIDKSTRKSLYPKYYSLLNTPGIELPEDPLAGAQPVTPLPVQLNVQPAAVTTRVTGQAYNAASAITPTPDAVADDDNPEMRVFSYFLERLLLHFPHERSDFLTEVEHIIKEGNSFSDLEKEEFLAWRLNPGEYQWNFTIEEKSMSSLIHQCYVILCDMLGPIEADRLYHQVLDDCKLIPAAKKFSPARFL